MTGDLEEKKAFLEQVQPEARSAVGNTEERQSSCQSQYMLLSDSVSLVHYHNEMLVRTILGRRCKARAFVTCAIKLIDRASR